MPLESLPRQSMRMHLTSPAASADKKAHIEYDLVGYIPVDELPKAEQA